ncbi:MAG: TIR domain-containing protein [Pyrinomonadaceae bacterium]
MKVFISWSAERSLAIAKALHDWLPRVIQAVQPWLSETDIGKGTRWEQEIGVELAQTRFGILCLTPENLDARWINFEAGPYRRLSKRPSYAPTCLS